MASKERHEWRVETEEGIRIYKAVMFAGEWKFATSMKGTRRAKVEWEDIDEPTDEIWEQLRDVLFRKYQRKRCPWKFVEDVDRRLGRELDDIKGDKGRNV